MNPATPSDPSLREPLARAFRIGTVAIDPPVLLAPMADVTNRPFRRLCKRIGGCGLVCTELVSAQALWYGSERTRRMLEVAQDEQPVSIQIFGASPAAMADGARAAVDAGAAIVDINMGCWVPKVCRQGAGAALLREPAAAMRVVEAVVRASRVPVTVKLRAGWSPEELTAVSLVRQFERLGARAFTLHARTAQQGFTGSADWRWIAEVKEAVGVPVVGNGDVRTPLDAERMLRSTGCDGVMVGRAAIGNPWAVRDIGAHLTGAAAPPAPTREERLAAALEHLEGLAGDYGEDRAVRHLRGQLPHYFRGCPGAASAREKIHHTTTIAGVREILAALGSGAVAIGRAPEDACTPAKRSLP